MAIRVLFPPLALLLTLVLAPQVSAGNQNGEEEQGELVEEPGILGTYAPFWTSDNLPQEVDDIAVPVYLLNILPLGGLWAPLLLLEEGRPDFGGDVLVPYLLPTILAVGLQLLVVAPPAVIGGLLVVGGAATANPIFLGAGALCLGLGCLCTPVPMVFGLWVAPTASLNAWGRAYNQRANAMPLPAPGPARQPPEDKTAPQQKPESLPAPGAQSPAESPAGQAPTGELPPDQNTAEKKETQLDRAPKKTKPEVKPKKELKEDEDGWIPY